MNCIGRRYKSLDRFSITDYQQLAIIQIIDIPKGFETFRYDEIAVNKSNYDSTRIVYCFHNIITFSSLTHKSTILRRITRRYRNCSFHTSVIYDVSDFNQDKRGQIATCIWHFQILLFLKKRVKMLVNINKFIHTCRRWIVENSG